MPSTTGANCTQWNPCLPDAADRIAFETHSNRAVVAVQDGEQGVHIRVENFARGRVVPGSGGRLEAELKGVLNVSVIGGGGGVVCGRGCGGHGVCRGDELLGECECEEGWVGRFCEIEVKGGKVEEQPEGVEGGVEVLVGSGVVEGEGVYRWGLEDSERVLVRGRVLKGEVVVEGEVVEVGGGGSGSGMYVWESGEWKEGEVVVGRLGDGGRRDVYEWVRIVEAGEERVLVWVLRNESFGEGDAVYSVRIEGCEGLGALCGKGGGGGWEGIYVGIGVVLGVFTMVGCIFWGCWWWYCRRGRGKSKGGSGDGAWEGVEVGGNVSKTSSISR